MELKEGYKKTDVGVIPQDWNPQKLETVLNVKHGKSQREVIDINGKYPILATGGVIGKTNCFLYDKPSVLIGRKGTIDNPQYMDTPFWTIDTLFYSEIFDNHDPKFLYYLFCKIKWNNLNEASGVPSLSRKVIENIVVIIPPLPKQQAIATALSDIDGLISSLTKLINKKKYIKQGAMQELLTGKKRLDGFSAEWVEVKLSEVLKLQGGYSFKSEKFIEYGIPVIRISNLVNGKIDFKDTVCYEKLNIPPQFRIKKEDILLAMSGATTGKIAIYDYDSYAYLNQRVGKFVIIDENKLINRYLRFILNSNLFTFHLSDILTAGAQPNISSKDIEKMIFTIPTTLAEQTAIAALLSDMDAEINDLEQKIDKYKNIKQGMMQELLTGRRRLV
jgi:type I restriction enzyme S subunit